MFRIPLAIAAALYAGAALAQAPDPTAGQAPERDLDFALTIGVGAAGANAWRGSSNYTYEIIPFIDGHYKNILFIDGANQEAGANFLRINLGEYGLFEAGAAFRVIEGRSDNDDLDVLSGLPEISAAAYAGLRLRYQYENYAVSGRLMRDISQETDGVMGLIDFDYRRRIDDDWSLNANARFEIGDESHNDGYFGVTPEFSGISVQRGIGVQPYLAPAGPTALSTGLSLNYSLFDDVTLTGFTRYERLLPAAADSDLIDRFGSANQFRGGLILTYKIF